MYLKEKLSKVTSFCNEPVFHGGKNYIFYTKIKRFFKYTDGKLSALRKIKRFQQQID